MPDEDFELSDKEFEEAMASSRAYGRLNSIQKKTLSPEFKTLSKKELEALLNRAMRAISDEGGPQYDLQFKDVEQRIESRLNSITDKRRFRILLWLNIFILTITVLGLLISNLDLIQPPSQEINPSAGPQRQTVIHNLSRWCNP